MQPFEILFDYAEPSSIQHGAYAPYGNLGFPVPTANRPWIYSNFVQSLDGITSFLGVHPSGGEISQSTEDQWLMGLLRAHADAIIIGLNTLIEETRSSPYLNGGRGPVYRVEDAALQDLRRKLGRGNEKVVFVTGSARLEPAQFRVFDGDQVDAYLLSTSEGTARLRDKGVKVISAGSGQFVDLPLAMRLLRKQLNINYLLCEGGPTLYGHFSRAGLIDEKFLTIAPVEIGLIVPPEQGPPVKRPTAFITTGFTQANAPRWRWMSCRRAANHQFSRYRRLEP
ncbi:MAG: RibD family protein [Candidatus Angelobacter sp.]